MAKENEKVEVPETVETTDTTEAAEATEKSKKAKKNAAEELVEIEIPISETQQDDWFCCVNGRTFQVQRGEKVKVPKWVMEFIDIQGIASANLRNFPLDSVGISRMGNNSVNYSNIIKL